jgi:hypothetical protein
LAKGTTRDALIRPGAEERIKARWRPQVV